MKNKFTNYMVNKGLFQLFLITCAMVFLYPFVWLMVTSVKTGEENLERKFLPSMPAFKAQSPYVREVKETARPESCTQERWLEIKPILKQRSATLLEAKVPKPTALWDKKSVKDAMDAAAEYATSKAVNRMPTVIWKESNEVILAGFDKALSTAAGKTEGELKRALKYAQCRMLINSIKVRSKAGKVISSEEFKDGEIVPFEMSSSADKGSLKYDSDGRLVVCSDFSDSDEPLVLKYRFTVNEDPQKLNRVAVGMVYDDTWHQLDAEIELNGVKYTGTRTKWAGENKSEALTLQFPDDVEDVEWGKRPWVNLDGPAVAKAEKSEMVLTIKLSPSGTSTAVYGKVKRNYERIFLSMPFWGYVWNSVVLTVLIVLGAVFSSCFVAYAFARLQWPGRSVAFMILLSTMMLPPQVTMIPQFLEWKALGWYNTLNPIWVPAWFGIAFFIFLMVQQMKGIPKDLEEAAEVDGMNRFQIWWYVIIPLVRPGMAAIAIMAFMGAWNEFMAPLIYLRDMGKFPLSVGIYAMGADETMNNDMALIMAGNFLMTLPVILIFFAFQRYFIQGVASSGVKG